MTTKGANVDEGSEVKPTRSEKVEVGLIFDFSVRGKTADVSTAIH
jgi:hypothetical protein